MKRFVGYKKELVKVCQSKNSFACWSVDLMADPLDQSEVLAKALRDLDTEGGFNAQLRDHFYELGVYETLVQGLDKLETQLR